MCKIKPGHPHAVLNLAPTVSVNVSHEESHEELAAGLERTTANYTTETANGYPDFSRGLWLLYQACVDHAISMPRSRVSYEEFCRARDLVYAVNSALDALYTKRFIAVGVCKRDIKSVRKNLRDLLVVTPMSPRRQQDKRRKSERKRAGRSEAEDESSGDEFG
ncbi:hypothetical protein COCSUDRAFT_32523 [Coccomyxa subellipsoidea C-169]|uniref:Uncharacterized protein n=1 Tax=Coccomyxa subellipsoidea (strain C-169) TaxID=574566 RepID=I0Z6F5_COCSC|nr:hypothetical protein COCSUDRAFT_32523 [Coccomyxa subellipsoidea C-169]EIE26224.1 hypothetical protein COCSUDRAFT_32523 [Coccomyxa subellipsoidea C-169]|eukprot:XP_005650768.1 hypothetical protein COCSUDRAFT_32523 [Coccomyxa subellipsoidea C-169]